MALTRSERELERERKAAEKERLRQYAERRIAETERKNQDLETRVEQLENLLSQTLTVDDFIDFTSLKQRTPLPPFAPGDLARPIPPPKEEDYLPRPLSFLQKLLPGATTKHTAQVEDGRQRLQAALQAHATKEQRREEQFQAARATHEQTIQRLQAEDARQHAEIEALKAGVESGNPSAVVHYFTLVLKTRSYPPGFPRHARLAYVQESKQLVVELDLPTFDVVPEVGSFKYVKARDEISEVPRPATQRKALYASVLAQVTIRTLHELFEADRSQQLESIVFNGHVETIDPGTGQLVRPCLITVRTTRAQFAQLDLSRVDPLACLKVLSASVSKSPTELAAVRPVVTFDMVDPRFVEETDVLSTLDQRPNLMALTPSEFESLITNLFEKMGLEARQTQASRDGGVDCVAFDPRPIFGGKVVIQAKRYKHTVGVSAVRDLYGTLQNEGASKGILVTTSGYGSAAFEFAKGKPIELLSGTNLLYLLAEHAGIDAKIEAPDDWKDLSAGSY